MKLDERYHYLSIQQERYQQTLPEKRGVLLDEMATVTGYNRKYLIGLVNGKIERQPRQRQRGRTYTAEIESVVLVVAESLDFICGKRLQPALLETAGILARYGECACGPEIESALRCISASTIERMYQRDETHTRRRLPRKRPQQRSEIARLIPMERIPWDEPEPGHCEADLVHHSGPSTSGDYVHTLNLVDVRTAWSARYAILGRSGLVMHDAFQALLRRIPFPIREIHTDNGSEFLNAHLYRFWQERDPQVRLTRSRPWQKNDSRFVEQKNSSLVRDYLGHRRFDTVAQTWAINDLYERMDCYYNLFQPVMRVVEKIPVVENDQFIRIKRRYDQPATPLARLCASGMMSTELQERLQQQRQSLNPRQLRKEIYDLLDQIRALPNAAPGEQPDVYLTLARNRPAVEKGVWRPGQIII